jgi:hypothetical protein
MRYKMISILIFETMFIPATVHTHLPIQLVLKECFDGDYRNWKVKPTSNPRIRAALPLYNLYGLLGKQIRITYMFLLTNAFHIRLLWLNHESRHEQ